MRESAFTQLGREMESGISTITKDSPSNLVLPSFRVKYIEESRLWEFLSKRERHILSVVQYGNGAPLLERAQFPIPQIGLPQLNDNPLSEVWTSQVEVKHLKDGDNSFSYNDEILFGCITIDESLRTPLEKSSYSAYKTMFQYSADLGYPYLFRVWNYLPDINRKEEGLERYKRFCMGRHDGFSEAYENYKSIVPAGTAVGTSSGKLVILFLSSKRCGKNIENPRQVSAYDYPPIYGPKSPSFARATLMPLFSGAYLFLAGTASIVGHATQHRDDPVKQTLETVCNLETLVEHAQEEIGEILSANPTLNLLKVYVRHHKHFEVVKNTLEASLSREVPILFLRGEMCRKDLLMEIEGILAFQK